MGQLISDQDNGDVLYCCLGVLYEEAGYKDSKGKEIANGCDGLDSSVLPSALQQKLMDWNDSDGVTFKQIAEAIEEAL